MRAAALARPRFWECGRAEGRGSLRPPPSLPPHPRTQPIKHFVVVCLHCRLRRRVSVGRGGGGGGGSRPAARCHGGPASRPDASAAAAVVVVALVIGRPSSHRHTRAPPPGTTTCKATSRPTHSCVGEVACQGRGVTDRHSPTHQTFQDTLNSDTQVVTGLEVSMCGTSCGMTSMSVRLGPGRMCPSCGRGREGPASKLWEGELGRWGSCPATRSRKLVTGRLP